MSTSSKWTSTRTCNSDLASPETEISVDAGVIDVAAAAHVGGDDGIAGVEVAVVV